MVPPTDLFTSNTWDGREKIKEGEDPRVPAYWYGARFVIPLALSSVLFLVLLVVAIIRWLRYPRVVKPVDLARERVVQLLSLVQSGNCSKHQHLELDGLVREHFLIGPKPASQLDNKLWQGCVVAFLQLNAPAVYAEKALDAQSSNDLRQRGNDVLAAW